MVDPTLTFAKLATELVGTLSKIAPKCMYCGNKFIWGLGGLGCVLRCCQERIFCDDECRLSYAIRERSCDNCGQHYPIEQSAEQNETCSACNGKGRLSKCICDGRGWYHPDDFGIADLISEKLGFINKKITCKVCKGTGTPPPVCSNCDGTGKVRLWGWMRE